MPPQTRRFPFSERRLFKAGKFIYKFKIREGATCSGEKIRREDGFSQELEDIIRTVLGNLDDLQPFSSTHYTVYPHKKRWRRVSKHDGKELEFYPFVLTLYLGKKKQNGGQAEEGKEEMQLVPSVSEPQPKRYKTDSPLEEAILKALTKDLDAERRAIMSGTMTLGFRHKEEDVTEEPGRVDKIGARKADNPLLTSGDSAIRESEGPGEMEPGTTQDMAQEEEEEDDDDETPGTPERPGVLMRVVSHIFPFSLFFKDP
ncbi:membrane-anchored junction protein [Mugil cephalus]|uniref:membrane-anchored junction protein n=1 Tax=Mugil cephalus TaxID=48193 RepID=UPI001FB5724F|nr:membrane-anchored junction protein [Mugil cephalus]